jgi:autotransporter-associated beta strand protein
VNTYSGQTAVGRGILKIGANNSIPSTSLLNIGTAGNSLATFDLNGFDQMVGGLAHTGANFAKLDNTGGTTNTLTINQTNTTTYSGAIAGGTTLNLVKSGIGQLTLIGDDTAYGGITTVSNGTLLINSDLGTSTVYVKGGTLGGTGSISGAVTNQSGTLSPGTNGIGTLTIANDLTLTSGSSTLVQVNQGLLTADQVTGLNTVTYGGTLVVTNLSGTLDTNSTFALFSANTHVGNFSSISGSPGSGLAWSFTNGVLSVVAQSYAMYPTNINASVSGSTLTLTWPTTHLGWILQSQTNALSVGLTTPTNTWFDVPGSSASNTNTITINAANPTVFYRLRLP